MRHAEPLAQVFARDRARGHAHHRLARRGAAAAAIVAQAVFLLVGVVGVAGPEAVLDLLVVARALILVLDEQPDRRAGGLALEHAREDAHLVALAPLARELRGAGAAAVHVLLHVRLGERQARRTAVDDAAERGPVAFAEARHQKTLPNVLPATVANSPSDRPPLRRKCRRRPSRSRGQMKGSVRKRPQQRMFGIADLDDQDARDLSGAARRGKDGPNRISPSLPDARPIRGSCRYSRGKARISRLPT